MTEILELDDTDDLAPDHWAGVHRFYDPRPQQEIDRLVGEFFRNGGVAQWLPPQKLMKERKHYEYYAAPDMVRRYEAKRQARQLATDAPKVAKIEQWLRDHPQPTSRRQICKEYNMSDPLVCRLLQAHFKEDPRAKPYMREDGSTKEEEQEELDKARKELIEMCVERGHRGYAALSAVTGLSENVLRRVVLKYGLQTRKLTKDEISRRRQNETV